MAGAFEANVLPHDYGSGGDLVERHVLPQPDRGHGRREVCHQVPPEGGHARPNRGEPLCSRSKQVFALLPCRCVLLTLEATACHVTYMREDWLLDSFFHELWLEVSSPRVCSLFAFVPDVSPICYFRDENGWLLPHMSLRETWPVGGLATSSRSFTARPLLLAWSNKKLGLTGGDPV